MTFKIAFIFISIFFINSISAQEITIENIWTEYQFFGKGIDGFRSMSDGDYFSKVTGKSVTKHKFSDYSGKGEMLISEKSLQGIKMQDYSFNADETKALIVTEQKSIYRRSYSAVYYLLDLQTKEIQALDSIRQPQTLAMYSPDGKKVSYIYKNNLYIKNIETGEITGVTADGKKNEIINGTTDWVYEEEFAITQAYDWSPDSKFIAYLKFNESQVKDFTMMYFNELYPTPYTFRYPKAGEDNSKVTAHLFSLKTETSHNINLGEYEYIPRLKWSNSDNKLILQTLNRHQNNLKYHLCTIENNLPQSNVFFEEKSATYVEIDDNLLILKDGHSILRTSEVDGFNHIYQLNFSGNSTQITKGEWDVIEFLGIDDKNETIYYTSAEQGAIYKTIYKINIDGKKKKAISPLTGSHDATFTNGMKYFVKSSSDANTPPTYSLCKNNGAEITVLEDNGALKKRIAHFSTSKKEFIKFNGKEKELNGWMIKPVDFDPTKKYPVYINIYGGPGANTVSDSWGSANYMYHQLLAQKGYIVISVDPRGTMYRGTEFKKSTYLQLGKLETEDFIAVAKELQGYDYVDGSRIGIMGWSYGGFMTSLAMTKGADFFKMGIAVAPVTNWRYYDNIYTERFMRTPQENPEGYDSNSPINFTDKLKGKYLLIHGSGDDNVHYQNTMEMVSAMVASNKQFDLFIYPNKNHGIYGGNTRNHLYNMMLNFTLKNL